MSQWTWYGTGRAASHDLYLNSGPIGTSVKVALMLQKDDTYMSVMHNIPLPLLDHESPSFESLQLWRCVGLPLIYSARSPPHQELLNTERREGLACGL